MAEVYGKDDPRNEYRIFRTDPGKRCALCAFRGHLLDDTNFLCVRFNQPTSQYGGCNKFQEDRPLRKEDIAEGGD